MTNLSDPFHDEVAVLMAGIRSSISPIGRADALLAILGGNTTLLPSLTRDSGLCNTFLAAEASRSDITATALSLISDTYFDHSPLLSKELLVLVYALSIDENWRACLASQHSAHALVRNTLAVAFSELTGRHSGQAALNILSAWVRPIGGPFVLTPKFGEARELQEKIFNALFGAHWWMFHAPAGDQVVQVGDIKIWPDLLPTLLPPKCTMQQLALPEIDQ